MASGFIEVSGYSSTDLQNKYNEGYGNGYAQGKADAEEDLTSIEITENGTYTAEEEGVFGFKEIDVDVNFNTTQKTITQNGHYDADDEGYNGYSSVTVNVAGGGGGTGPFHVIFFDSQGQALEEATVPYGGGAVYHGVDPVSTGMRFVGWNPNPVNVTSDLNCYPRFENILWDPTQLNDDWVTIAQRCQANPDAYNIGNWKYLELNGLPKAQFDEYASQLYGNQNDDIPALIGYKMVLVGKGVDRLDGENGYANTTWLASAIISLPKWPTISQDIWRDRSQAYSHVEVYDYTIGPLRQFLNGQFLTTMFPQALRSYIKSVIKYTHVCGFNRYNYKDQPSRDKIWIPSIREVLENVTDANDYLQRYGGEGQGWESLGPVYYPGGGTAEETLSQRSTGYNWFLRSDYNPYRRYTDEYLYGCYISTTGQITRHSAGDQRYQDVMQLHIGFCI